MFSLKHFFELALKFIKLKLLLKSLEYQANDFRSFENLSHSCPFSERWKGFSDIFSFDPLAQNNGKY